MKKRYIVIINILIVGLILLIIVKYANDRATESNQKGHSGRVAAYSKEIARRYGYDEKRQENIFMMGLLHDVGKILGNIKEMPELAAGAKWHHERYDGKGYPEGISGKEIPEEARIIAVADAYDAMTSNRSYRGALPIEIVRDEIEKGKGNQFDPMFADIMLEMIDDGSVTTLYDIKCYYVE